MTIVNSGLMRAVKKSSALYEARRCHLPDILITVDAFYSGLHQVEPLLNAADGPCQVVLGTVAGDIHEIGKNLVRIMLEAHGIKVLDLGVNVKAQQFVDACEEHGAAIVGLSCFITTARPQLEAVMAELQRAGQGKVKVVVGGAAASNTVAAGIGAQGFAPDAVSAVKLVQKLLAEARPAG
jgi:methanogenic corrinoid protein MtbC1